MHAIPTSLMFYIFLVYYEMKCDQYLLHLVRNQHKVF